MPIKEYAIHRILLCDGIKKILDDGFDIIAAKGDAPADVKLQACRACSTRNTDDVYCLDVDSLKRDLDYKLYGFQRPSVDLAVPFYSNGVSTTFLLIEAKLGEWSTEDESRPRHPGREELFEKYKLSKERLNAFGKVSDVLYFIVPRSTYKGQRYRASRWNKGSRPCDITVRCCDQLMNDLGLNEGSQFWLCEYRLQNLVERLLGG